MDKSANDLIMETDKPKIEKAEKLYRWHDRYEYRGIIHDPQLLKFDNVCEEWDEYHLNPREGLPGWITL